jgi:hypothetical protein
VRRILEREKTSGELNESSEPRKEGELGCLDRTAYLALAYGFALAEIGALIRNKEITGLGLAILGGGALIGAGQGVVYLAEKTKGIIFERERDEK